MGPARAGGEGLDLQPAVADDDRLARRHRLDALRGEADVHQGHALAGRGEQRPFDRVAQRLDAQRIAGDDHVAQGVEEHEAVGPVELLGQLAEDVDQLRPAVHRKRRADLVHEDFGVGLAGQVVVVVAQQLLAATRT